MPETQAINVDRGLAIQGATVFGRFNDFACDTEIAAGTPFIWTTVNVGGGAATPTTVDANTKYGAVTLTCGGNEDDGHQALDERACFLPNRKDEFTVFYDRFDLSEATQIDVGCGLFLDGDTSLLASLATDFIAFITNDGDTEWDVVCSRDSTVTRKNAVAVVDTGTHEYAFVVEPYADSSARGTISWYIDGQLVHKFVPQATLGTNETELSNLPYDEHLSRGHAVLAGAASAYACIWDCIGAWHICPKGRAPSL